MVANAGEGEPGSIKDRHVVLDRTGALLDGLELACRAVGAREEVVYFKGSFAGPARPPRAGPARTPPARGRGAGGARRRPYVAGEETAVLEVLEGRRAWPRPKPPLPASVGLNGRPTLVHNVETLARVPEAIANPAGFRSGERTLVSIWGDVRRPGVHDVALGTPLGRLIEEEHLYDLLVETSRPTKDPARSKSQAEGHGAVQVQRTGRRGVQVQLT